MCFSVPWQCVLCTSYALCFAVLCSAMLDTVWALLICNAFYILLVQMPPPPHTHSHPHKTTHPGVFHKWRHGPHHLDLWHRPLRWLGWGGVCGRPGRDWHVRSTAKAVPL